MQTVECRHEHAETTATTPLPEVAEHPREDLDAERVDELGICEACGRRVMRLWRFGEWSPWVIDA
jgi:hypothetical protein